MALRLRRDFGLTGAVGDDDLERLCATVGVDVQVMPLPCAQEFVVDHHLILTTDLSHRWRRWLTAHGIGHILHHTGNHLAMSTLLLARQEHEANDFAGWLLCAGLLDGYAEDGLSDWELSDAADAPVECVRLWLTTARGALRQ